MTDQLIVYSRSPYNAEPSLARFRASYKTPQADFYVRCHANVPLVSFETFALAVDGLVAKPRGCPYRISPPSPSGASRR